MTCIYTGALINLLVLLHHFSWCSHTQGGEKSLIALPVKQSKYV